MDILANVDFLVIDNTITQAHAHTESGMCVVALDADAIEGMVAATVAHALRRPPVFAN